MFLKKAKKITKFIDYNLHFPGDYLFQGASTTSQCCCENRNKAHEKAQRTMPHTSAHKSKLKPHCTLNWPPDGMTIPKSLKGDQELPVFQTNVSHCAFNLKAKH